jgi:hypothetical protein
VTSEEQIRSRLSELLDKGTLPLSACSNAFLTALRPALQSGVVVEEKSGAGRRLVVLNSEALRLFFAGRYPNAQLFENAPSRVAGIARFRDSKVLPNDAAEIVCLRAWENQTLFHNSVDVNVVQATKEHGVFAFALSDHSSYSLDGPCALVENPVVFALLERLRLHVGIAILGRGRISGQLLDWMTQIKSSDFKVIHLPDYDPVGLNEFARLRGRLRERIALYVPSDLEKYFDKFSNRALLGAANSQTLLRYLRRSDDSQIQTVLDLIDKHNAGLEQEALLLDV